DVPAAQPFVAEPQLLDHAQRRLVLRPDADLHAVQAKLEKAVVGGERDSRRGESLACEAFGHPVADARRRQGTVADPGHVQLTGEGTLVFDGKRKAMPAARIPLQAADAVPRVELARAVRAGRLPPPEPGAIVHEFALQLPGVTHPDRADGDTALTEGGH